MPRFITILEGQSAVRANDVVAFSVTHDKPYANSDEQALFVKIYVRHRQEPLSYQFDKADRNKFEVLLAELQYAQE